MMVFRLVALTLLCCLILNAGFSQDDEDYDPLVEKGFKRPQVGDRPTQALDTIHFSFDFFAGDAVQLFCDGVSLFKSDSLCSISDNQKKFTAIVIHVKKRRIHTYNFLYKERFDKSYFFTDDSLAKPLNLKTKYYTFKINHKKKVIECLL